MLPGPLFDRSADRPRCGCDPKPQSPRERSAARGRERAALPLVSATGAFETLSAERDAIPPVRTTKDHDIVAGAFLAPAVRGAFVQKMLVPSALNAFAYFPFLRSCTETSSERSTENNDKNSPENRTPNH